MHIIELKAENVKCIKAVQIRPTGPVVQITGANGSGKSSVLDAIYYALAGTSALPSQPVRTGEEKAIVRLDLGEIVVTRRFTAAGGTTLTVEAANGAKFPSPQRMLDDLLGALSFDPLEFSRMVPKQQLETLRKMVPLAEDIDALDVEIRDWYDTRASFNKEAKSLLARADSIVVPVSTPKDPVDVTALVGELTDAAGKNAEIEKLKSNRRATDNNIARLHSQALLKRHEAARILASAQEDEKEALALREQQEAQPAIPEPVDVSALQVSINSARTVNYHVNNANIKLDLYAKLSIVEAQAKSAGSKIAELQARRDNTIKSAATPIDGLAFGAGEVLYSGLPLAQASSAEQLRISVGIAMAANPKLRILRIKDGSLLDENSLAEIESMATLNDYQVWIERVDTSGVVGIVMVDGTVVKDAQ